MIKIIFLLYIYLTQITAFASNFKSYVNKDNILENEIISVTFEYDDFSKKDPDFSPLKKDFKILSSSKGSQTSIINGYKSLKTSWELELLPLNFKKTLVIPSIKFEQSASKPIVININENNNKAIDNQSAITFIAHIDKPNAYINEQVVLTLTLKTPYRLLQGEIEKLVMQEAIIEELGETKTNEEINNGMISYSFTKKYAIFFDKSKSYNIPSLTFEGLIQKEEQINSFFMPSFFSKPQRVIARSLAIPINIKPIPKEFPTHQTFIPLDELIIEDKFPNNNEFNTNDAITRTFSIKGVKTLSSMLPIPIIPNIDGIKTYSENSNKEQKFSDNAIESQIKISHTYIPQKPGDYNIKEQIIYWWDTKNDTLQTSIIKAIDLKILGESIINAQKELNLERKQEPQITSKKHNIPIIIILSIVFALIIILAIIYKLKTKQKDIITITINNLNKYLKSKDIIKIYDTLFKLKLLAKEKNDLDLLTKLDNELVQKNILNIQLNLYNKNDVKIDFKKIYEIINTKNNSHEKLLKPLYPDFN